MRSFIVLVRSDIFSPTFLKYILLHQKYYSIIFAENLVFILKGGFAAPLMIKIMGFRRDKFSMKSIKEMPIKELESKLRMLKIDKLSAGIGFALYYDTQIKRIEAELSARKKEVR